MLKPPFVSFEVSRMCKFVLVLHLPVHSSFSHVTAPWNLINMQGSLWWPPGTQPQTPRPTQYQPERLMTARPHSCSNSSPITASLFACDSLLLHVSSFNLPTIHHSHFSAHTHLMSRMCSPNIPETHKGSGTAGPYHSHSNGLKDRKCDVFLSLTLAMLGTPAVIPVILTDYSSHSSSRSPSSPHYPINLLGGAVRRCSLIIQGWTQQDAGAVSVCLFFIRLVRQQTAFKTALDYAVAHFQWIICWCAWKINECRYLNVNITLYLTVYIWRTAFKTCDT